MQKEQGGKEAQERDFLITDLCSLCCFRTDFTYLCKPYNATIAVVRSYLRDEEKQLKMSAHTHCDSPELLIL